MSKFRQEIKILREENLLELFSVIIKYIYRVIKEAINIVIQPLRNCYDESFIRSLLPNRGYVVYNSFKIKERRLGDKFILGKKVEDEHDYEREYVDFIREYVKSGEDVVVIGGHYGISTAAAAMQVGESGSVTTYEASLGGVEQTRKTVRLNNLQERVNVIQAIVGIAIKMKRDEKGSNKIDPSEIPDCDTLAIDCDGCEFEVLNQISGKPNRIIIEHHDVKLGTDEHTFEYNEDRLISILNKKGYEIVDKSVKNRSRGDKIGRFVAEK